MDPIEFQLTASHDRFSFYHERACDFEAAMLDLALLFNVTLTVASAAPRQNLPEQLVEALHKLAHALEGNLLEASNYIQKGPAYQSMTHVQTFAVESEPIV